MEINIIEAFPYVFWFAILEMCYIIFSYWLAGEWITAFIVAWYKKTTVLLEWTKTKRWKPFQGNIIPSLPHIVELDHERGIVRLRREAIGYGSNKIPMAVFASENVNTINPVEFEGQRYYEPALAYAEVLEEKDPITNAVKLRWHVIPSDQVDQAKLKTGEHRLMAKYPITSAVAPHEFVEYQEIDNDPAMYAQYANHKVKKELEKIKAPIATFFRDNVGWLAPLIICAALAFMWMQQNNAGIGKAAELAACQQNIATLYQTGVCKATALVNSTIATQSLPTGGGMGG